MAQDWLRLYRGAVNNPKVQRLGLEAVGFWTNCLCLSDDEGRLPKLSDLAWSMRVSETVAETFLKRLHETGLLEKKGAWFVLHDWHEHQFKSDSSTDRVRRFRQKQHETQRNVSETAQNRTESDTETEQKDSVATQLPPGAAFAGPLDFKKELWGRGVPFLKTCGIDEAQARAMLGKWRKTHGDFEVLNALAAAEAAAASEPLAYIQKTLNAKAKANGSGQPGPRSIAGKVFGELYAAARAEREGSGT